MATYKMFNKEEKQVGTLIITPHLMELQSDFFSFGTIAPLKAISLIKYFPGIQYQPGLEKKYYSINIYLIDQQWFSQDQIIILADKIELFLSELREYL